MRLRPITEKVPKPMVEINNRPFLEYQLELLAKNDIIEVVLLAGYLWEKIHEHFGDTYTTRSGAKLDLKYSVEPRFLGTGGAVKNAEKLIDQYFFVVYGDSYIDLEYQAMAEMLLSSGKLGLISVYDNSEKIANNNVQVDQTGLVQQYNKHQESPEMNGVEAGAMVFSKEILELIPDVSKLKPQQKISLEMDVYPKLINQNQLLGYLTNIRFYDMGTFGRIKTISEVLK